ncbi:hypothetical protein [Streptomyces sp. NPDC046332]|uniref:hypothetical protein n=1 Tax=Streptomyces sp. NPDC046332 TaxID=3155133 RepID=UPI0033D6CADC
MDNFEPATGGYPDAPCLPLLTAAEARKAVSYTMKLEALDLTAHGRASGALAHEPAARIPSDETVPPTGRPAAGGTASGDRWGLVKAGAFESRSRR